MSSTTFRKTLIALAIAGASLPLQAETIDLADAPLQKEGQSYGETVTVTGNYAGTQDAIVFDRVNIAGDLLHEGNVSFTAPSEDVEGGNGIVLKGGSISGRLINSGAIKMQGTDLSAIELTNGQIDQGGGSITTDLLDIAGIVNAGTITAQGTDATGILVDYATFSGNGDHIVNTGLIQATHTGIEINEFVLGSNAGDALHIVNSGTIIADAKAIDASPDFDAGNAPVELEWTGGAITGNLEDLSKIVITNSVSFTGTQDEQAGANIRMADSGDGKKGSVSVGSGSIAGHLNLLGAQTTIDGDLFVSGNSSLTLNLSDKTDAASPILDVTQTASFADGSQVILAAKNADFAAGGKRYQLIKAGTFIDNGLTLKSSNQLLTVSSVKVSDKTLGAELGQAASGNGESGNGNGESGNGGQTGTIDVIAKTPEQFRETIANGGGSRNAQSAGAAFTRIVDRLPTRVRDAFDGVDEAQAAELIEETTPENNGGATQAAITGQTLMSNLTSNRTGSLRGASTGDVLTETGVWVQALYSDANQDLRDGVAGYNAYSRGIAVGADGKLNERTTLGVAYSALHTDVNGDTGNKTEVMGHAFTLYGGYELGNYFVDASVSYGLNDNEGKRRVFGETAKSDYDSRVFGVNVTGGYTYHLDDGLLIEPRVAARYSSVDIDSFREKGAALGLRTEDQRYEVFELGAGVRVAGSLQLGQGTLEPQARLMAFHDFAADQASSTSTFTLGGTPFVTSGARPVRNSYEAGLGADYHLGAITVGVNYDYVGKSGFDADTFTAKVRYDF